MNMNSPVGTISLKNVEFIKELGQSCHVSEAIAQKWEEKGVIGVFYVHSSREKRRILSLVAA